jgi:cytidyltransferase-like protein
VNHLAKRDATGVYWGRFNPPHQGHLSVIRKLNKEWNLIVAIGSSEHRNERSNPFSGAERKRMLESYLDELKIRGVKVVTLKDGPSQSWSVANLIRKCKPDVLFLSTEKGELAELAQRRVPVVFFRRTGRISSTRIRDSIASGDDAWKRMTGGSVARWIARLDGVRRIRTAYGGSPRDAGRREAPPDGSPVSRSRIHRS